MYYVYILQSIKTGQFYKGLTNDFERRLKQHLSGKVDFTKTRLPIKVIHVEICGNREEARSLEKFFKTGYGREIIKEISEQSLCQGGEIGRHA